MPTKWTDLSVKRDVYSNSMFCVSPAGDSFSIVWLTFVLMSTCIPVNVNDFVQLPLEETLPMMWTDLSVNIKDADALQHGVLDTLRKLAEDRNLIFKTQAAG